MDFRFDKSQAQLKEDIDALLARHPAADPPQFDAALYEDLEDKGFIKRAVSGEKSALLDAVYVIERLSSANAVVPFATGALLSPLFAAKPAGLLAIRHAGRQVPVRYAAQSRWLVEVDAAEARLFELDPQASAWVKTNYVYPFALPEPVKGKPVAACAAADALRRWRLAIAAEAVGAMDGAMAMVVGHLSNREQFGQKLGSLQALQHRMAEHAVALESSRWLVRDAAWHDDNELAALAAAFTTATAHRFAFDAHQLCGARGFLLEFGLYRWTLRMKYLSLECGGTREHANDAAVLRWGAQAAGSSAVQPRMV